MLDLSMLCLIGHGMTCRLALDLIETDSYDLENGILWKQIAMYGLENGNSYIQF